MSNPSAQWRSSRTRRVGCSLAMRAAKSQKQLNKLRRACKDGKSSGGGRSGSLRFSFGSIRPSSGPSSPSSLRRAFRSEARSTQVSRISTNGRYGTASCSVQLPMSTAIPFARASTANSAPIRGLADPGLAGNQSRVGRARLPHQPRHHPVPPTPACAPRTKAVAAPPTKSAVKAPKSSREPARL